MKHSVAELLETVYQYYPRGLTTDDPGYRETDTFRRLSDARRRAGVDRAAWSAFLGRASARFPQYTLVNRSLHLQMGTMDAGYSGRIILDVTPQPVPRPNLLPDPDRPSWERLPGPPTVGFMISFICPYYITYIERSVDDIEKTEAELRKPFNETIILFSEDTCYVLPASVVKPEIRAEAIREHEERLRYLRQHPLQRLVIDFEPLPDEKPIMDWLVRDIEATFGCEPMSPEVGNVIVPDVVTTRRELGEARLYDCLLADDW
jgi:hypothetical protein